MYIFLMKLDMGQSYDCPSASQATQRNMNKMSWYLIQIMNHVHISYEVGRQLYVMEAATAMRINGVTGI